MKAKFEVGAQIDFLTKEEMRETLADWLVEVARGVKFRTFSDSATVAGGVYQISDLSGEDTLGPNGSMLWSVTGLAVSGGGVVAGTDTFSVFVNDASPVKLVRSGLTRDATWDIGSFVLNPLDRLIVTGVGTGAANPPQVLLSGRCVEVPLQLAWKLL